MTKADKRALAYAKSHAYLGYDYDQTYDAVKYGYLQAEKDLALTWEDVKNLDYLLNDVNFENGRAEFLGKEIPFDGDEGFYEEVLKRFNEQRKK